MDNLETLAILGTQDKQSSKTQHNKYATRTQRTSRVNPGAQEG
jgi:hypothetical protein